MKELLRKLRRDMDITQCELAKAIGVERSTVSKWEKGENFPRGKTLIALADFFHVSVNDILSTYKEKMEGEK